MGLALILSIFADDADVGPTIRDCRVPQGEAEVSSLQGVGFHRCSVGVTMVLIIQNIISALHTHVDCWDLELITVPDHCCGATGNINRYLTGQQDRLLPFIHLIHFHP